MNQYCKLYAWGFSEAFHGARKCRTFNFIVVDVVQTSYCVGFPHNAAFHTFKSVHAKMFSMVLPVSNLGRIQIWLLHLELIMRTVSCCVRKGSMKSSRMASCNISSPLECDNGCGQRLFWSHWEATHSNWEHSHAECAKTKQQKEPVRVQFRESKSSLQIGSAQ